MLCVMRREGRGVVHLGKYSPPKAICSVEEERKREKEKMRKKREKEKERKKKDNGKEREPAILLLTNRGVAAVNGSALREVGVFSYSG